MIAGRTVAVALLMLSTGAPALLGTTLQEAGTTRTGAVPPLFASDEVLELTLVADLHALLRDRDADSEERPSLVQVDGAGPEIAVDVRTRGNFRLRRSTCSFPPFRLDFPRSKVEGTVFEGQDKLKLVTHCRGSDDYEQNTLEELLAYRILGTVAPWSYLVRAVRITYVDESGEEDTRTKYGFLIESEEALAARLGGEIVESEFFDPRGYLPDALLRVSLFNYMIGNADWSVVEFHNATLLRLVTGQYIPLIYDFDYSGLVDAGYAKPDPSLGIRSVRERIYRGVCVAGTDYVSVFADFLVAKGRVLGLIEEVEGMTERTRARATDYLEDFYRTLESDSRRQRAIEEACRPIS